MSNEVKTVAKTEEPTMCTKKEQLGHAIGVLGHDAGYTMWTSWMMPFFTDIMMLPAAVLGAFVAIARVVDAFTDISMGVIADRTRSRWGRFRPWLVRTGPFFCVCLALSFLKLPVGLTGMCIFAGIMYFLTGSIAFTSIDIPFWSLPAAMTSNTKERSGIIGTTTTASNFINGMIGIVVPLALARLGAGNWTSYFYIALCVAIFSTIMYVTCFKLVREHVVPDDSKKFSFKLAIQNIVHNQPLLCLIITYMFLLLSLIVKANFNYYYCMYNLGNMDYLAVINTIGLIGGIVGSLLFVFISKHIEKKTCMFALAAINIASNILLFTAGESSLMVVYLCSAICKMSGAAGLVCVNAMMADTMEYGEWKTGQRNEALITSTRCFSTKLVSALTAVLVTSTLGLSGYVPLATQSASTLSSFHVLYSLVCAGIMVIAILPMFFYKLTGKRHAEIVAELAARKVPKNGGQGE